MKQYEQDLAKMRAQIDEMQKKLTLNQGVGIEKGQDGNQGMSQEVTGEVDFEKQGQMTKKQMLISKMKMQG